MHARNVVQYSGMHLEAVCRWFLRSVKHFGAIRFDNTTLGKATYTIDKTGILDHRIIEGLFSFIPVYNKSKHEINNDDSRLRLFSPEDGLTAYFCARVLGIEILKNLNYEKTFQTYQINNKMK